MEGLKRLLILTTFALAMGFLIFWAYSRNKAESDRRLRGNEEKRLQTEQAKEAFFRDFFISPYKTVHNGYGSCAGQTCYFQFNAREPFRLNPAKKFKKAPCSLILEGMIPGTRVTRAMLEQTKDWECWEGTDATLSLHKELNVYLVRTFPPR